MTRSLRDDERGVTLVEFAFVAPVLLLFLMGIFDIAHALYLRTTLEGAMQRGAREATLERSATASAQAAIDQHIAESMSNLSFGERPVYKRRFYRTFRQAAAARPEDHTDKNGNGVCDAGEPYVDANNNSVWDRDGGDEGQGLASDRSVYTVSVTYPRLFPLWRFVGGSDHTTVVAKTVLMNQPYTGQKSYGTATSGVCA